ncbi:MAG: homocysteine S-methyltransferase family protein [Thiobacillus sp.]|uniref:homocysteine S-methyltransferase family protein n=1 Tax=Thiobacillus sp. TaxID=924 RepID=UPI0027322EDD|nr:homocysteine S-methyltransferase family protein [Thiobacillus sp.]MDP3586043.1 homocysteine S-methyltransferase family protein [Thiobacillus sp.]
MNPNRRTVPQLADRPFLTDSGLETTLIFHDGLDLPCFASFVLLDTEAGRARLWRYYAEHVQLALDAQIGIVLETTTWRANPDWGAKLGYDAAQLAAFNRAAVAQLVELRAAMQTPATPIVISGNLGPRGDGYRVDARMSVEKARVYHAPQVETLADTEADLVSVFTMNYVEEAIGVVLAARAFAMPVVVSFTVETDGRLPSGMTLAEAIRSTDDATGGYPAYYMLNCAHPSHFAHLFDGGEWQARLRGVRANASKRSHAELDEATEIDIGDIAELAQGYRQLAGHLPSLAVVGGCCGTDCRHVAAIRDALLARTA